MPWGLSPRPGMSFFSSPRVPAAPVPIAPRRPSCVSGAFLQGGLNLPKETRQIHNATTIFESHAAQPLHCPSNPLATAKDLLAPLLTGTPPSHLQVPWGSALGPVLPVLQFKFKALQKISSYFPFIGYFFKIHAALQKEVLEQHKLTCLQLHI